MTVLLFVYGIFAIYNDKQKSSIAFGASQICRFLDVKLKNICKCTKRSDYFGLSYKKNFIWEALTSICDRTRPKECYQTKRRNI